LSEIKIGIELGAIMQRWCEFVSCILVNGDALEEISELFDKNFCEVDSC